LFGIIVLTCEKSAAQGTPSVVSDKHVPEVLVPEVIHFIGVDKYPKSNSNVGSYKPEVRTVFVPVLQSLV
jgi:hypothetical protein